MAWKVLLPFSFIIGLVSFFLFQYTQKLPRNDVITENPDFFEIKEDLYFVGVLDKDLEVFDIIMETKYGTSYNAYLVVGKEKTALIETVKVQFFEQMLSKVKKALNGRNLDYIVHNHNEPDHSGSSAKMLEEYPEATIIASENGLLYLHSIWNFGEKDKTIKTLEAGKEITKLDLGGYTLEFYLAPFLHWPDSMFTYCEELQTIFTCDVIGSHYAAQTMFDSDLNKRQQIDYEDSFKYYYDAIFGPFKRYVVKGLEIINSLKEERGIKYICPSHGPVITKNIDSSLQKYQEWSKIEEDKQQVCIISVSAYGYTTKMAKAIKKGIEAEGIKVILIDPTSEEMTEKEISKAIHESKGLLFGSPTILSDALPNIWQYLKYPYLNPITSMGKIGGSFGSYGWTGEAVENIDERMDQLKVKLPLNPLKFRFNPSEKELEECSLYGSKFAKAIKGEEINERTKTKKGKSKIPNIVYPNDGKLRVWRCIICGERVISVVPPSQCPACSQEGDIWVLENEIESTQPTSTYEGTIAIVGAGSAGIQALKTIRSLNSKSKIILFSEEQGEGKDPYYRPSLTKEFQKVFDGDNKNWMKENGVEYVNEKVVSANDERKELTTTSGKVFTFDKLILATGSKAINKYPNLENSFQIYTKEDIDRIVGYIDTKLRTKEKINVGIFGAGLLGIEISELLISKFGKNKLESITMIEAKKEMMSRQFDDVGRSIYTQMLKDEGIDILTDTKIKEIKETEGVGSHMILETGKELKELPVDIILISTGTIPNLELAKDLNVEFAKGRGGKGGLIKVNEFMQTSKPHIFAVGNIAQHGFFCIPNYLMALQKGIVAGSNIVGIEKKFKRDLVPAFTLDSFERNVFSSGSINTNIYLSKAIEKEAKNNDSVEYVRLGFKKNKTSEKLELAGILFIARKGEKTPGPKLLSALQQKISMSEATELFFEE